jgi:hypothetical protein
MEILITPFVNAHLLTGNASDFSCSEHERGSYAGKDSYAHAVETSEEFSVVNAETRPQLEKFFGEFGAWDREEIQSWSDDELNGVCLQLIAGDYKEWENYQDSSEDIEYYNANLGSRFISADDSVDGEYYYYFGN